MFVSVRTIVRLLLVLLLGQMVAACEDTTVDPTLFGALEGVVLDGTTNAAVANAVVTTNPATSSFTTDAQGKFTITNVPVGRYALTVRKTDYTAENVNVTVDANVTTAVTVVLGKATGTNVVPNAPYAPAPVSGATNQPVELTLKWRVSDPNGKSDSLRSDVLLYESVAMSNGRILASGTKDTMVVASGLKYNTTYLWQVTVRDKAGLVARSTVWSFTTRDIPNNHLVFVRRSPNGTTDIYSSNELGGDVARLTNSPFVETAPKLNFGRLDRIAYTVNNGPAGEFRLYTMSRDGSNQALVTTLPIAGNFNNGIGFCWSPDGTELAFASSDKLYRIDRNGTGGPSLIATAPLGRHFRELDWNAQALGTGRIIVQTVGNSINDSEIYLVNLTTGALTLLIGNLDAGRMDSPTFNRTGTQFMYTHDEDLLTSPTGLQGDSRIFIQNLDGTGVRLDLSASNGSVGSSGKDPGSNDLYPRFSESGGEIYFVNVRSVEQPVIPPAILKRSIPNAVTQFRTAVIADASL